MNGFALLLLLQKYVPPREAARELAAVIDDSSQTMYAVPPAPSPSLAPQLLADLGSPLQLPSVALSRMRPITVKATLNAEVRAAASSKFYCKILTRITIDPN